MRTNWQVGDLIKGRWEIYKILQGGAGIVYIVYDQAFREPFAAKTFQDEVFAYSPTVAERFMREALAWTKLDAHPNVTEARMVETIEGKPYLFLEYVSGGDLGSWIGTPMLTEDLPQVLRFAVQFCDGMIHAFSKGIRAHRDIKPRNCLVTRDGVLKVTDFGLAKLFDEDGLGYAHKDGFQTENPNLTVTAIGTCTHMPPEQFESSGQVGVRTDIYSFGVMLYQMIKGELPFIGENWKDLEHLHKTQPPPRLESVPQPLEELVQTCLAKDPAHRFSSFEQVRERLVPIYKSVAGVDPPTPVQSTALTAAQWNNKGSSLDNLGRQAESIDCYNNALRLDPEFAPAWFNKGVALAATRHVKEALDCYDRALRIDPGSSQGWSNKGVALKSLGKTDDAIACYDRAISCNPRYPNSWINKGVTLRAVGRTEDALTCYNQALRLNPNDANAWTNKGNVLYLTKRLAEALECYDRALAINSRQDLTWLNKGMALSALGRHEEALHCYRAVLEINPRLDQAWLLMGMTLVNNFQKYREAIPYFEEAERLGAKDATNALAVCRRAASNVNV